MNIREMIEFHEAKARPGHRRRDPVPRELAERIRVIETAPTGRIVAFHEKTPNAPSLPGNPDMVYASMATTSSPPDRLLK